MNMLFIGHLTLDDVVLRDAPTRMDCPGGAALYAASGAYLWQREGIHLLSRRGTDFDLSFLDAAGVDVSAVRCFTDTPSIHLIVLFDRKELRYFIVQRWGGSYDHMAPRPEDLPQELLTPDACCHVAAFPLPRQQAIIEAIPEGTLLSVDPHHDYVYPEQHTVWERLLRKIRVFLPSEDELLRYFSLTPFADPAAYKPYLRQLSELGPEVVVLKLGARGALGYDRRHDALYAVPAYPAPIVDVTGCGDSFCGGFMASYAVHGELWDALVCGSISASFNITHFGVRDNFSVPLAAVTDRKAQCLALWKGAAI